MIGRRFLWSDESPFTLRFKTKKRVWRLHKFRYEVENITASVKHDLKINVWGAFSANGVGVLRVVHGIKKHFYIAKIAKIIAKIAIKTFYIK
jgi:hypothetical protein